MTKISRIVSLKLPWRSVHIGINVVVIVTAFCAFLPLGYVQKAFKSQCILYADIKLTSLETDKLVVNVRDSLWGKSVNCDYGLYTTVIAGLHAFLWCWFFLLMKGQLKHENREFTLLLPALLMNAGMFVCVLVSSSIISGGADVFCRNLVSEVLRLGHNSTCGETLSLQWDIVEDTSTSYSYLVTSKVSTWLVTLSVLCQVVVCGVKLAAWVLKQNPNSETVESWDKIIDGELD